MFQKLLQGLMAPDPAPLPDTDARLALAALLVRIARSDNDYAQSEIDRIDRILAARYALCAVRPKGWRPRRPILCALPARSRTQCPMKIASL